jgi:uncharacterized membrane protein
MVDAQDAAPTPLRSSASRWWMALLVVSLALNLLVAGVVAMRFFAPERLERFIGAGYSPLIPRRFMSDLPADRRKAIGDLLRKNRGAFHDDFAAMRKFTGQLADALEHEPYDETAVTAAIEAHAKVVDGMIDRGAAVTIEAIGQLSPEERALLAKRIRERANWRK